MQNETILTDTLKFRTLITQESDRACALMAAAYLDVQLTNLLRAVLVEDTNVVNDLFEPSKPIGTFSAKIDMAYLLGLLSKEEQRDLHLIRKIRNAFGHDPAPIDFSTPAISSRACELTHTWHDDSARPRAHFTSTVMAILATVTVALITKKHANQKPNTDDQLKEELAQDKELLQGFEKIRNGPSSKVIEFLEKMDQETMRAAALLEKQIFAKGDSNS